MHGPFWLARSFEAMLPSCICEASSVRNTAGTPLSPAAPVLALLGPLKPRPSGARAQIFAGRRRDGAEDQHLDHVGVVARGRRPASAPRPRSASSADSANAEHAWRGMLMGLW